MFDHITLGVSNFDRCLAFYDRALKPLNVVRLVTLPVSETDGVRVCAYGTQQPQFWIAEEKPARGLIHIAFAANSRTAVEEFYEAALAAGGVDNGAPGLRPHYHSDYFAAFVLDPQGHNIEAVCHRPSP